MNERERELVAAEARKARFDRGDHFEVAAELGQGAAVRVDARMAALMGRFFPAHGRDVFHASNLLMFNRMLRGADRLEKAMKEALVAALADSDFDAGDVAFVIHAATALLDVYTARGMLTAGCPAEVIRQSYPVAMQMGPEWVAAIGDDAWLSHAPAGIEVIPEDDPEDGASRTDLERLLRGRSSQGARSN